jgi:hypothetical protein
MVVVYTTESYVKVNCTSWYCSSSYSRILHPGSTLINQAALSKQVHDRTFASKHYVAGQVCNCKPWAKCMRGDLGHGVKGGLLIFLVSRVFTFSKPDPTSCGAKDTNSLSWGKQHAHCHPSQQSLSNRLLPIYLYRRRASVMYLADGLINTIVCQVHGSL